MENTKDINAEAVRSSAWLCPVCGEKMKPKAYGPFFTPDPVYRVAMTCQHDHWRGRMCATRDEAEGHNKKIDSTPFDYKTAGPT